jgi:hypothetical protein
MKDGRVMGEYELGLFVHDHDKIRTLAHALHRFFSKEHTN